MPAPQDNRSQPELSGNSFIIVGAPRTGSTLLVRTLNSIPGICCHGELLNAGKVVGYVDDFDTINASETERKAHRERLTRWRDSDPEGFLDAALKADSVAGLKLLYGAILHPRWRETVDSLLAGSRLKIIHLRRRNRLRRYLSEQVMKTTGATHSGLGGGANRFKRNKLHIDVQAFQRSESTIEQQAKKVSALCSSQPTLEVDYENLAQDFDSEIRRVTEFLGVDIGSGSIRPALEKIGANDLREAISNYAELAANPLTQAYL
ncbi:Stf0 family sulfotransferase [Parahaliea aestuarii]|uniref:Sulfotransferase domain-containing protein n=1 Tax=Parahaliea aestuarii TaxID=1852021 RepID=A0A5C9A113_9GAMM|nr:Stf0 family sulfotransferase [Parahaliea aestuarii]TXS94565.1 hypothetical protein FVW59_01185 [Parahaliea aestuarii]